MHVVLVHRRWFAAWLLVGLIICLPGTARADELQQARQKLDEPFAASLEALATWCEQQQLAEQAAVTRGWLIQPHPQQTTLVLLEPMRTVAAPPAALEAGETLPPVEEWSRRFQSLRNARADELFALAGRAIAARQVSAAYGMLLEGLRENPDHAAARRILGYQLFEGRWLTAFELSKVRAKQVWHPQFGWLPADRVARYEAGERYQNNRWISAEEDARLHATIERGWTVNTEHFSVRTNHSLEEGVRLAQRLEQLYEVWRQMFWPFYASEEQLIRFFASKQPGRFNARKHKVVYFRDRQQYMDALRAKQPNIEISTGFYLGSEETAYFFAPTTDAERAQGDSNLFHEATHQLFGESRAVVPNVGRNANFWIIEGIACYMESLQLDDGSARVGGLDNQRVAAARYHLMEEKVYEPLENLTAMGMRDLQADPRIATLYSQSAALTQFLLHDQQQRYRVPLVKYLLAVYMGRDKTGTLAEFCEQSYQELDQQYRDYIKQEP